MKSPFRIRPLNGLSCNEDTARKFLLRRSYRANEGRINQESASGKNYFQKKIPPKVCIVERHGRSASPATCHAAFHRFAITLTECARLSIPNRVNDAPR